MTLEASPSRRCFLGLERGSQSEHELEDQERLRNELARARFLPPVSVRPLHGASPRRRPSYCCPSRTFSTSGSFSSSATSEWQVEQSWLIVTPSSVLWASACHR